MKITVQYYRPTLQQHDYRPTLQQPDYRPTYQNSKAADLSSNGAVHYHVHVADTNQLKDIESQFDGSRQPPVPDRPRPLLYRPLPPAPPPQRLRPAFLPPHQSVHTHEKSLLPTVSVQRWLL